MDHNIDATIVDIVWEHLSGATSIEIYYRYIDVLEETAGYYMRTQDKDNETEEVQDKTGPR